MDNIFIINNNTGDNMSRRKTDKIERLLEDLTLKQLKEVERVLNEIWLKKRTKERRNLKKRI